MVPEPEPGSGDIPNRSWIVTTVTSYHILLPDSSSASAVRRIWRNLWVPGRTRTGAQYGAPLRTDMEQTGLGIGNAKS